MFQFLTKNFDELVSGLILGLCAGCVTAGIAIKLAGATCLSWTLILLPLWVSALIIAVPSIVDSLIAKYVDEPMDD